MTDTYLNGDTERIILDTGLDEATVDFVAELFATARYQYGEMAILRDRLAPIMKGAFAIIGVTVTSMTDVGRNNFV